MNIPQPTQFWTEAELELLEEFLLREDGPDHTMDTSMLDGFLCAVVSGPTLIMPAEVLRWVMDTENGLDQPVFHSREEASDITNLILRQWNAINDALTDDPQAYGPLLTENRTGDAVVTVIDEWCTGYYKGMSLDLEGWMPLMVAQPDLLSPMLTYGTSEGWELLERYRPTDAEHRAIANSLGERAQTIHAHWLKHRQAQQAAGRIAQPMFRRESVRRDGPKIGRNDPCPCASGRKYKVCHGAV